MLSGPVLSYDDAPGTARHFSRKTRGVQIPLWYLTDKQCSERGCIAAFGVATTVFMNRVTNDG